MTMTEAERNTEEHAAHLPPKVHVVDEATTEEIDNKTDSKEEDVNCSTAETSKYTIIRILKSLLDFGFRISPLGSCEGRGKGDKLLASTEQERKEGRSREGTRWPTCIHSAFQYRE